MRVAGERGPGRITGGRVRRGAVLVGAVMVGTVVAGCASPPSQPGPPVPTFAPSTTTTADAAAVPLDPCSALITPTDVANVLGLDSAKVNVRTVQGMPSPTVGRTEKLDCIYTADKGRMLFTLRSATYSTPDAAQQQWQRNAGLEDGDRRDITVGPAIGLLYTRRSELLLSTVVGARTLAVQVPDNTVPEGRARENLIVDFAQRALKVDPAATPAPTLAPVPATPGSVAPTGPPANAAPNAAEPTRVGGASG